MQDIILVGSGGCMREIVWQMQEQNKSTENWNILGYVDKMPPEEHSSVTVGNEITGCWLCSCCLSFSIWPVSANGSASLSV